MSRTSLIRLLKTWLILFWIVVSASTASAREIVDMVGRTVTVPDVIRKVYGSSPPATYMIYSMSPDLLAGLNWVLKEDERAHLRPGVKDLPVIGGWFGQGTHRIWRPCSRSSPTSSSSGGGMPRP